jgi:hypothetical protein
MFGIAFVRSPLMKAALAIVLDIIGSREQPGNLSFGRAWHGPGLLPSSGRQAPRLP